MSLSSQQRVGSRRGLWHVAGDWLPVIVWMAVIFGLSHQSDLPHHPTGLVDLLLKKAAHVSEYAVLAVLVERARTRGHAQAPLLSGLMATAYALTDEWHQMFVPGRHASLLDVLVDVVGILAGLGLSARWRGGRSGRDDDLAEEPILSNSDPAPLDELKDGQKRHDDLHS